MDSKYRVKYKTDIIVLGWNHGETTELCINSVYDTIPSRNFRLTYVDNGSHVPFDVSKFDYAQAIYLPFNHGFVRGSNAGLALSLLSDAPYVMLLNNDTMIPESDLTWLGRMVQVMENDPKVGAVGAVTNNVYGYQRREKAGIGITEVPAFIGFCVLLRKSAIEKVGLLDERFEPGGYEDFDYSVRLHNAGYKIVIAESVWIYHQMHASFNDLAGFNELLIENRYKFIDKWGDGVAAKMGISRESSIPAFA